MTRFEDLSEADQRAVRAAIGRGGNGKPRRATPSRAGSTGPGVPLVCHYCPATFTHWGVDLERHRDALLHHRFDLVLTGPS